MALHLHTTKVSRRAGPSAAALLLTTRPPSPPLAGFWCAVMSTILSGLASLLLVVHLLDMLLRKHQRAPGQLHLDGRIFLFAEMTLVALIALQALVFSRIEHWTYLDGLYFSVVSLLTIGFGDYSPKTTAGRIVLFPFVITGFALLANQISLIVSISSRNTRRYRQQLQALEEATIGDLAAMKHVDDGGESYLRAEARRLRRVTASQRSTQDLLSLSLSLSTLVAFWLTTAGIYTATDGWTFGDSLYFSYVAFFTIGYGDFSPSSPAGKTVFVFWAMVAVPFVTNFVVTAIQTIVTHFSRFLTSRTREKREEWEEVVEDYFVPHPRLVREAREKLEELRDSAGGGGGSDGSKVEEERTLCESCVSSQGGDRDDVLIVSRSDLRAALELSLLLESRGRDILIEEMKAGSTEWLLLQADRNVQERYLSDIAGREDVVEERAKRRKENAALLDRIAEYRRTYARWLVMGGRLLRLDGEGLREWERRRDWRHERMNKEGDDHGGKEA